MRPSLSRDLAVLLLAVAVCRSPALAHGPRPKPAPRQPVSVKKFEEEGYGVTERLAKADALDNLRNAVLAWLASNRPDITYMPSQADLEGMVRGFSPAEPRRADQRPKVAAEERGHDNPDDPAKHDPVREGLDRMLVISVQAELTDQDLRLFEEKTRYQLSQHRQAWLARGLAGAVALLAVTTGYLRLEEKVGRHKRKLGVAAATILGLAGLALLALSW
jgi:hypothetical protein